MTIKVCSHHFWGAIWTIINILCIIGIVVSGSVCASHDWKTPPNFAKNESDANWSNAFVTFTVSIVFLFVLNGMAVYMANERYHWFAIKDCERK